MGDPVKFIKCSKEQYDNLVKQNMADNNTLYFVMNDGIFLGENRMSTSKNEITKEKEYVEI